uniref:Calcium dependent secretion activator n=1 Tax=Ursus maritimus TaxID=29073 RepID=A0A452VG30_URSMA
VPSSCSLQISKQQLQTVKDRFQAFLNGETQIVADEAFMNAVQSYYEVFLKSDRVARMVQSGGCSANDSREVFKKHIEKRVRSLPEIDGLSKETVLSSWMAKFDAIYRGEEDPRKQQARMTASCTMQYVPSLLPITGLSHSPTPLPSVALSLFLIVHSLSCFIPV